VKDGDVLSLGNKTLRFINAVNLHWPDSVYTYVEEDRTLITCDSFGAHYSFDEVLLSRLNAQGKEKRDEYIGAVRFYFDMIMAPFKPYMLKAVDKIKDLDIDMICPGHGPVLDDDPWCIVNFCRDWSQPAVKNSKKTVVMPYVSAYGYTAQLAGKIADGIRAAGDIDVKMYDMMASDKAEVMEELRASDGMLFGTPTILGDALGPIWDLVISLFPGECVGKAASAFGAFGWSGEAVPDIMARLSQLRTKVYGAGFKIRFKPSDTQLKEAFEFGKGFGEELI